MSDKEISQETEGETPDFKTPQDKTSRGRSPSSRIAKSRSMQGRSVQERRAFLKRSLENDQNRIETYIDPDIIPEGYTVLWARELENGRPASANLYRLTEKLQFFYAHPSDFPTLCYKSPTGESRGDEDRIRLGDCVLMLREKELDEEHKRQLQLEADKNLRFRSAINMDPSLHPFTRQGSEQGGSDFASTGLAASFLNAFGE